MSLGLLDPLLEESLEEGVEDELLHVVCVECNGGVVLPLMQCYCGHWDPAFVGWNEPRPPLPPCEKCEELRNGTRCPNGHRLY